jgi:hypothetical protein
VDEELAPINVGQLNFYAAGSSNDEQRLIGQHL